MAASMSQRNIIIQDENLQVNRKKTTFDGKIKNSNVAKKGKESLGVRKPLGDLTNKKALLPAVSSKKQPTVKEENFNIAEEGFLHDHKKCTQAKGTALTQSFLDLVLPKCDMVSTDTQNTVQIKDDLSDHFEPEELDMSEFSDWEELLLSPLNSPPQSRLGLESPPSSPFAWQLELVDFTLKDEF